MENRNPSVSLDQQKAFDRVNHSLLMGNVGRFGLGLNVMKWINVVYDINSKCEWLPQQTDTANEGHHGCCLSDVTAQPVAAM